MANLVQRSEAENVALVGKSIDLDIISAFQLAVGCVETASRSIVVFSTHDDVRQQLETVIPALFPGVELVIENSVKNTIGAIRSRMGSILMVFVDKGSGTDGSSVAMYMRSGEVGKASLNDPHTPIVLIRRDPSVVHSFNDEMTRAMLGNGDRIDVATSTPLSIDEVCIVVMEALHKQIGTFEELNAASRQRFLAEFFQSFSVMVNSWRVALEKSSMNDDPLFAKVIELLAKNENINRVLGLDGPLSVEEEAEAAHEAGLRTEEEIDLAFARDTAERHESRIIDEADSRGG